MIIVSPNWPSATYSWNNDGKNMASVEAKEGGSWRRLYLLNATLSCRNSVLKDQRVSMRCRIRTYVNPFKDSQRLLLISEFAFSHRAAKSHYGEQANRVFKHRFFKHKNEAKKHDTNLMKGPKSWVCSPYFASNYQHFRLEDYSRKKKLIGCIPPCQIMRA